MGIQKQSLSSSTRLIIREWKIMIHIYDKDMGNLITLYKTKNNYKDVTTFEKYNLNKIKSNSTIYIYIYIYIYKYIYVIYIT